MRGDVFAYRNPAATGHEQSGRRFAVIVQSEDLPLSTVLVAPTSTRVTPTDFRAEIELHGKRTFVLTEHTTAANPQRLAEPVGHLSHEEVRRVDECLRRVLDLAPVP